MALLFPLSLELFRLTDVPFYTLRTLRTAATLCVPRGLLRSRCQQDGTKPARVLLREMLNGGRRQVKRKPPRPTWHLRKVFHMPTGLLSPKLVDKALPRLGLPPWCLRHPCHSGGGRGLSPGKGLQPSIAGPFWCQPGVLSRPPPQWRLSTPHVGPQ